MRPLGSEEIRGTWGSVLLPINADETIDYERLGDQVDRMIGAGLDGLYTGGTAGELHAQTDQEFDRVNCLVAERCEAAGVPFQVGASHPCARTSLDRLERALPLEPGAFQVILPDWVPVTRDEAVAFLQRLAEAADPVGLVLYNPPHAKRVLEPTEVAELKEAVPALIGVKVADGDASWYATMRERLAGLSVFVPGHHLATGVLQGAHGSYSNVACLSPWGAVRWHELARTDVPSALRVERKILAFFRAHVAPFAARGYSNPALDKLLAAIGGWAEIGTRLRWPYRWVSEREAGRLSRVAREAIPELF
jgi:4-hydroxy-tetrahydrodipicolinate synthase